MTATKTFPGFREEGGLLWPEADQECARVILQQAADIEPITSHCLSRRSVVQAGGNCGLWPIALSKTFRSVYTFEPDAKNFASLAINTAGLENVFPMRAALGDENALVDMHRDEKNCGAYNIEGAGRIPVLTIDSLGLPDVDMIYLDIEGYEYRALLGAEETIARCSPVIAVEEKGLGSKFYKEPVGAVEKFLHEKGYRRAMKIHCDLVFTR